MGWLDLKRNGREVGGIGWAHAMAVANAETTMRGAVRVFSCDICVARDSERLRHVRCSPCPMVE